MIELGAKFAPFSDIFFCVFSDALLQTIRHKTGCRFVGLGRQTADPRSGQLDDSEPRSVQSWGCYDANI